MTEDSGLPSKQERFWAKLAASEAIAHADRCGHKLVTVRAGASPSGPKHIGTMNDQVRGHFIRKSVDDLRRESRHVLTSDDMDPLRTVPNRMPDGEGVWRQTDDRLRSALSKGLGTPACNVSDPFGCHQSYAGHFTALMMEDLRAINVDLSLYYVSELYKQGAFDSFIKETIAHADKAREVMRRFQSRVSKNWVPVNPICGNCGKLTTVVTSTDKEGDSITYRCAGRVLHGKYRLKGCGHKGSADIRGVKLPWRLEWVADWKIFETDVEPFGKEHYEGSWKSGVALAREVYGFEPPVPLVYEFFLIDGEKMSSRRGNVYLIRDLLRIAEPRVVRFLYVKKPLVQRDIAVKKISALVSEFDEVESLAHSGRGERAEDARVYYWYVAGEAEGPSPYRIPYDLAAYVTRFYSPEVALARLRGSGLLPAQLSEEENEGITDRLRRARSWNIMFPSIGKPEAKREVEDPKVLEAFRKIRHKYASADLSGDELQELIYQSAKEVGIPPSLLFREGYVLFLGQEFGPKLGNFLVTLDKDYVLKVLDSAQPKASN